VRQLLQVSLAVFTLKRRALGNQDIPRLLDGFGSLLIAFFMEPALLIFVNFTDHFVVEVLNQMEVIEHRLDVRAALFKRLLEIRVHIVSNS